MDAVGHGSQTHLFACFMGRNVPVRPSSFLQIINQLTMQLVTFHVSSKNLIVGVQIAITSVISDK